ncbi:MAG: HAD hydrolase-like protein [Muribaculum sp.]|nr:HAD hydrolase-like protein [Muribaculum sp.]
MISTLVAFDLDDTIYKERDFVVSGYRAVARELAAASNAFDYNEMVHVMATAPLNPFDSLEEYLTNRSVQQSFDHAYDIAWMVATYRSHFPEIEAKEAVKVLGDLLGEGYRIAMITDGRTVTQSNKIKALGLDRIVSEENISISETVGGEKFTPLPFERMMRINPDIERFVYVGDNPMKDFVWPNRLGWVTVQLMDNGRNVHSQNITVPSDDYHAQYRIDTLARLPQLLREINHKDR